MSEVDRVLHHFQLKYNRGWKARLYDSVRDGTLGHEVATSVRPQELLSFGTIRR